MITINRVTVGTDLSNRECLFVHDTPEDANNIVADSPVSDGVMMSTTTYHRAATVGDVRRLIWDQNGDEVKIELCDLLDFDSREA
jgi:hypothetical protein